MSRAFNGGFKILSQAGQRTTTAISRTSAVNFLRKQFPPLLSLINYLVSPSAVVVNARIPASSHPTTQQHA